MKSPILILVALFYSQAATAQCNAFFPMREGVKVHYDHYDKKDKVTVQTTQKLINVTGSGSSMKGTVQQEIIDAKKNEVLTTAESEWICEGGTMNFHVNTLSYMDAAGGAGNGMTMDVSGDQMDIPSTLQVGQTLKDVSYNLKMAMGGVTMMNRTFKITDRKVEAEENISTPAGTFNCYKVSFNTNSSGGIGGGNTKSIMWYAKDVGLVKSEVYSDNGKLIARQVLSKIEK
jgi:hypothetical protein